MRSKTVLLIMVAFLILIGCKKMPPVIAFQDQIANIGILDLGHPIATVHFKFKNLGGKDLIVKNAASDCSCTIASFTKKPLSKDQWGNIAVTVNYGHISQRGNLIRNVVVQSNTKPMLHTLIIKMLVK